MKVQGTDLDLGVLAGVQQRHARFEGSVDIGIGELQHASKAPQAGKDGGLSLEGNAGRGKRAGVRGSWWKMKKISRWRVKELFR